MAAPAGVTALLIAAAASAQAGAPAPLPATVPVPVPVPVPAPAPAVASAAALPAGFVDLAAVAPGIARDLRYAGALNFLGRPARGYRAARCLLTRQAAAALAEAQRALASSGLGLLVYDCYRPQRAVDDFGAWARDLADTATRASHYPAVPKSELFARGYIAARSGHSRGSTVDLTLVPLARPDRGITAPAPGARGAPARPAPGGKQARDCRGLDGSTATDGSLEMGTAFDCFDERSHAADPRISAEAMKNRQRLRRAMVAAGFLPYDKEWWHFTLAREPFPATTFDFEIAPAPPAR
jgi:D-alanyl-D-alanine dipeptidase